MLDKIIFEDKCKHKGLESQSISNTFKGVRFFGSLDYISLQRQAPNMQLNIYYMKFKQIAQFLTQKKTLIPVKSKPKTLQVPYKPTPYLFHPFLQSVYNISQPLFPFSFEREKIFFDDGGHISLDWIEPPLKTENPPILFIMHGLTGGSQMNYIKELMKPAAEEGYYCVCLNSRGINSQMTSPIPFTAMAHTELESALDQIQKRFPSSKIYMVGTSFGGNYLLRYFLRRKPINKIGGLVVLAPPLNVGKVVEQMGSVYQKFFVKRYVEETVTKHKQMEFWEQIGLVDMQKVKNSQNLMDFHSHLTAKLLGFPSAKEIFDQYSISDAEIESLKVKTLIMLSKDDPIVSYTSMPLESISKNENIKLFETDRGGHLCWFEGFKPKRWYPKPVLQYLRELRQLE